MPALQLILDTITQIIQLLEVFFCLHRFLLCPYGELRARDFIDNIVIGCLSLAQVTAIIDPLVKIITNSLRQIAR